MLFRSAEIKGTFIGSHSFETLTYVIEELRSYHMYASFTLIVSGSAAKKVMKVLHDDSFIDKVIIFCMNIQKYLHLMLKYKKIRGVVNTAYSVLHLLDENRYGFPLFPMFPLGIPQIFKTAPLITYDDYTKYYYRYHKLIANYFKSHYSNMYVYNMELQLFNNLVRFSDKIPQSIKSEIILNAGSANLINAYTGETHFCYVMNMWLRECDPYIYKQIKCVVGTLAYSLNEYISKNPFKILKSTTLYRNLSLRSIDISSYKAYEGDLICFPSFTSTSIKKDCGSFPSLKAKLINSYLRPEKKINKVTDHQVHMVINYDHKYGNIPLATDISKLSRHPSESEYVFPPFSFFRITSVEISEGTKEDPHIIELEAIGKKCLIEPLLREGKTMVYNAKKNAMEMV